MATANTTESTRIECKFDILYIDNIAILYS